MTRIARQPRNCLDDVLAQLDRITNWENRGRTAMRASTEPAADLARRLGSPHSSLRAVHIAGTKGKGSVAALIDAGLRSSGRTTARYTSPHLERITERVMLNGTEVADSVLAESICDTLDVRANASSDRSFGADSTWFDVFTVAALQIFRKAAPEWAIIEVGLGGRADSTNIMKSEIAVITNIELEHVEVLGSTREEIAYAKAGIIKAGSIVFCGVKSFDPVARIFFQEAALCGCEIHFVTDACETISDHNRALAHAVLTQIGLTADGDFREILSDALISSAKLPGRLERFSVPAQTGAGMVQAVLDGAHVAESVSAVIAEMQRKRGFQSPPVIVLALSRDKDADRIMRALEGKAAAVFATQFNRPSRAYDPEALQILAAQRNIYCQTAGEATAATQCAIELAQKVGTWVLITGSLYLVAEIRSWLISASRHR